MFDCVNQVAVCAHRGDCVHGMQNTMTAFRYAIGLGVDMVETDVRMSKDGQLFLMHDLNLEDLTDGTGRISNHTYEEIRSMNVAVRGIASDLVSIPDFEPVALLEELLDLAVDHPALMLNIEIKDKPDEVDEAFAFECARKTADMLATRGLGSRTWINSFSGRIVEWVHTIHGDTFHYHGFFPWHIMGSMQTNPWELCDVACVLNWVLRTDGSVHKQHTVPCPAAWYKQLLKIKVMPLTVSFYGDMQAYDDAISYGSRILMADDPAAMLAYVRAKGLHD